MGARVVSAPRRSALVHFVCDRQTQQRVRGRTLTIHEGQWAYCDCVHPDGHHWVPTGGVSYVELIAGSPLKKTGG